MERECNDDTSTFWPFSKRKKGTVEIIAKCVSVFEIPRIPTSVKNKNKMKKNPHQREFRQTAARTHFCLSN